MIQKKAATSGGLSFVLTACPLARPVPREERTGDAERTHWESSQRRRNRLAHRESDSTPVRGFSGRSTCSVGCLRSVVESATGKRERNAGGGLRESTHVRLREARTSQTVKQGDAGETAGTWARLRFGRWGWMDGFCDTHIEEKTRPTYANQEVFEKFRNKILREVILVGESLIYILLMKQKTCNMRNSDA